MDTSGGIIIARGELELHTNSSNEIVHASIGGDYLIWVGANIRMHTVKRISIGKSIEGWGVLIFDLGV